MATRKQFVELETMDTVIARGANTVGGTVIGDYIKDGSRVVVVKMPKVEKKAGAKKKAPKKYATDPNQNNKSEMAEVTHGA